MNNLIKTQMKDFKRQFQHLHTAAINDEHFKVAVPISPSYAANEAVVKRHYEARLLEKLTKMSYQFVPMYEQQSVNFQNQI